MGSFMNLTKPPVPYDLGDLGEGPSMGLLCDNAVTLYHSKYVPRCVALLAASQQWQEMFHPIEAPRQ